MISYGSNNKVEKIQWSKVDKVYFFKIMKKFKSVIINLSLDSCAFLQGFPTLCTSFLSLVSCRSSTVRADRDNPFPAVFAFFGIFRYFSEAEGAIPNSHDFRFLAFNILPAMRAFCGTRKQISGTMWALIMVIASYNNRVVVIPIRIACKFFSCRTNSLPKISNESSSEHHEPGNKERREYKPQSEK